MDARTRRFERLIRPVLSDLYRFARRLTRDPVRAEDLLQTALLRGLDRLPQLNDDAAFRAWQSRVLYTTWLNAVQRRRIEMVDAEGLDENVVSIAPGPDTRAADRQLGGQIADALDALPGGQREAVWLVDGQGFKYAEAATILGISPGTVASRVARGRVTLRRSLAHVAADQGVGQ